MPSQIPPVYKLSMTFAGMEHPLGQFWSAAPSWLLLDLLTGRDWETKKSWNLLLSCTTEQLLKASLCYNIILIVNPKHSTVLATRKKINSVSAETRTCRYIVIPLSHLKPAHGGPQWSRNPPAVPGGTHGGTGVCTWKTVTLWEACAGEGSWQDLGAHEEEPILEHVCWQHFWPYTRPTLEPWKGPTLCQFVNACSP